MVVLRWFETRKESEIVIGKKIMTVLRCSIVAMLALGVASAQRGGRGGAPAGRFKIYSQEAIDRGEKSYNSTCGYCHGARGKGGNAGPDLIFSVVTLHDEDGVQLSEYVKGAKHQATAKLDLANLQAGDIAAYLHSRVIYASGRGIVHPENEILVGNAKAGEAYFTGEGKCNTCHSVTGDLKGIGSRFEGASLQNRWVGGAGRGGGRRGGPGANPSAIQATITLPSGQTVKGPLVRLTDFDVIIRDADGAERSFARNKGVPKVDVVNPLQAHLDLLAKLSDTQMHNMTAYLATLK
jgi:mono/diheme cytochrome c family protein